MTEKTAEEHLAKRTKTLRKAGESMWRTPAGAHAIRLLETQEAVTIDDVIASLEQEAEGNRDMTDMYGPVILALRDLQERRRLT